jgi:hypothetical protein
MDQNFFEVEVYHSGKNRNYKIEEINEAPLLHVSFKITCEGDYLYTMVPEDSIIVEFDISEFDRSLGVDVDWVLFEKIGAAIESHYS